MKNNLLAVLALIICSQPVLALPPNPDNAALLYYQAFCIYEKPDDTMKDMVRDLANGNIEPNPTIIKYIEKCKPAVNLAQKAFELTECDWGVVYTDGFDTQVPYMVQAKILTYITLSDARIALKQENYELAIKRCLLARKLGIDVGQDPVTVGFLVDRNITRLTNDCFKAILCSADLDVNKLQQLKSDLDQLDSRTKPLEFFLETEKEVMINVYTTPEGFQKALPWLRKEKTFIDAPNDVKAYILNADSDFCRRNRNYLDDYWSKLFATFGLSYQQSYTKAEDLNKMVAEDCKKNTDAFIANLLSPAYWRIYNIGIQSENSSNALKAAIEIYMIKAKTGKLPDAMPVGLPKDLFSGKDFLYKKTDQGFTLRCQGKDLDKNEIYQYEFKVNK